MSLKLLLIVEESAGTRVLAEIAKTPYNVVAVMTSQPPKRGANCACNLARELGHKVWSPDLVKDPEFADQVRHSEVDVILNVHSLHIIAGDVLSAAKIGAFNLHPGPLPQYAGLHAPSWAIYNGETKHGVTLHKMEAQVDAGDIVFEESFEISDTDTGFRIAARCTQLGVPLVLKLLQVAAQDSRQIPSRPQNARDRRYFGKRVPHAGVIPWSLSAKRVYDLIRASDYAPFPLPWGRPRTQYKGREIAITKAAISRRKADQPPGSISAEGGRFYAACADEWIEVKRLYLEGRSVAPEECLSQGGRFPASSHLKT